MADMETHFLASHLRPGMVLSYLPGRYNPIREKRRGKWPPIASVKREGRKIVVTVTDDRGDRVLTFGPDDAVPVIPEDGDFR
jgi:hypothetical protein